jgi:hypothetical protein
MYEIKKKHPSAQSWRKNWRFLAFDSASPLSLHRPNCAIRPCILDSESQASAGGRSCLPANCCFCLESGAPAASAESQGLLFTILRAVLRRHVSDRMFVSLQHVSPSTWSSTSPQLPIRKMVLKAWHHIHNSTGADIMMEQVYHRLQR